ncbi:MAG: rRNA maturation RNase YbeY [Rikenellaceae bacterium]
MAIRYYTDDTSYNLKQRRKITTWLRSTAQSEGYEVDEVGVIFCSGRRLREMNVEFLQHDYFTDIITFDESDLDMGYIAGELYIDVDTVADNAKLYDTSPLREMHRVMVHGVLHLCGQGDKTELDAKDMRAKEDRYLSELDSLFDNPL